VAVPDRAVMKLEDLPMLMIRVVKAMIADASARWGGESDSTAYTPVHGIAARFIADTEAATLSDLAGFLRMTKQSASEIVAALEHGGYIQRVSHPEDGRVRLLALTDTGRAGLEQSRARWRDLMREWQALVGADELHVVAHALHAYLDDR
jgi:DNA-binding MarR family transcriptional regulator